MSERHFYGIAWRIFNIQIVVTSIAMFQLNVTILSFTTRYKSVRRVLLKF